MTNTRLLFVIRTLSLILHSGFVIQASSVTFQPLRWFAYLILAYIALGLQIGLRGFIDVGGAMPDFVLLAAIFIAINAPRDAAVLGCFGLGVMQDICSQQPLGLSALSLSLVAMLVVGISPPIFGTHPLLHFSLTLGCALMIAVVAVLQGLVRGPVHPSVTLLFNSAIYSALLAPIVIGVLQKMRKSFAFQPARRKMRF